MSYLVANPEDRFSRDVAQVEIKLVISKDRYLLKSSDGIG